MAIQNAGQIIREARLTAGLSQEKLSEGVCSPLSLSRIENGSAGVSPSTFQVLMAHAGVSCEAYPGFANRRDFDCFYTLKHARFYLDCWQLKEAFEELESVEKTNYAENKYYYQEWLYLYGQLQIRSGCSNHSYIYTILTEALHISRPSINLFDFRSQLLSLVEIELLLALAGEALHLDDPELCLRICTQVSSYVTNSSFSTLEKERFLAKHAIVYSGYLITRQDYSAAYKLSHEFRVKMARNAEDSLLHELTFLSGLSAYHTETNEDAITLFKTAFFSAHSIESPYATTILHYLQDTLNLSLYDASFPITEIPLVSYKEKEVINSSAFSDGTYDLFSPEVLTLGSLIRELRMEQDLSQQILCRGLCSKSKLSKIEHGTLQPEITLAQSLLQRLGISDDVFTFYGNKHETQLYDLRSQMTLLRSSDTELYEKHIAEMQALCSETDTFYRQYVSYKAATRLPDGEEKLATLMQILQTTAPNFSMSNIHNYRLSWLELTILNNYCDTYQHYFPSKGTLALYNLLEYYDTSNMDILKNKRLFSIPLCSISSVLNQQNRYTELIDLTPYFSLPITRNSLQSVGVVYGNYSQALGKDKQLNKVPIYATYAYYNLFITGSFKTAKALQQSINELFHIHIL